MYAFGFEYRLYDLGRQHAYDLEATVALIKTDTRDGYQGQQSLKLKKWHGRMSCFCGFVRVDMEWRCALVRESAYAS